MPPPNTPQPPPGPERPGTLLETDEDIRQALQSNPPGQPPAAKGRSAPKASPPTANASPYRPTLRPPAALLAVLDDGKGDGEVLRLRAERFVIGRSEGDFLIPHDELISGRHV